MLDPRLAPPLTYTVLWYGQSLEKEARVGLGREGGHPTYQLSLSGQLLCLLLLFGLLDLCLLEGSLWRWEEIATVSFPDCIPNSYTKYTTTCMNPCYSILGKVEWLMYRKHVRMAKLALLQHRPTSQYQYQYRVLKI